mmetsp:Transcript_2384/g.4066  ORF Transcript_2384/g.4066 Transcript_2384/m.4066 type:complete len:203 (-) Transcript_2384:145-753(-)
MCLSQYTCHLVTNKLQSFPMRMANRPKSVWDLWHPRAACSPISSWCHPWSEISSCCHRLHHREMQHMSPKPYVQFVRYGLASGIEASRRRPEQSHRCNLQQLSFRLESTRNKQDTSLQICPKLRQRICLSCLQFSAHVLKVIPDPFQQASLAYPRFVKFHPKKMSRNCRPKKDARHHPSTSACDLESGSCHVRTYRLCSLPG